MPTHFRRRSQGAYELVPRSSSDDSTRPSLDEESGHVYQGSSAPSPWLPEWLHLHKYARITGSRMPRAARNVPRRFWRYLYWGFLAVPYLLIMAIFVTTILTPSYTSLPKHYMDLQARALSGNEPGRANVNHEKVFIAATIYDKDGELVGGEWGRNVLDLIDLLGPDNVFLSIYENDPDAKALAALNEFKKKVKCQSSVVSEHLELSSLPRVTLPTGETRLKRIAFLAEVRNRALAPLQSTHTKFDKLLFVNDVFFSPLDAAQLLFSTGQDEKTGRTNYGAACAVDFINPFKFYDRFATRDLEGYSMGIPFYPWFTDAGNADSRNDVLNQKDAVRVRSCWGGMTAFEASWFQQNVSSAERPYLSFTPGAPSVVPGGVGPNSIGALRFRYEADTYWDASECCLIHADLQYLRNGLDVLPDSGIYMNPFIRVAYDPSTLSWLPWSRRPERLYSIIHNILDHLAGLPEVNSRLDEQPGDIVRERVWSYTAFDREGEGRSAASGPPIPELAQTGQYREVERVAGPGRFCGGRKLLVLNESPKDGEKNWVGLPVPVDI